jgi:periplasmic divalent cation tolerance protein
MTSEAICEVVITAPDPEWLAAFTRRLVDERLCASGHVITQVRSLYRWQGQIYDRAEGKVALHTRVSLLPEIIRVTTIEHPYEVPCVVATPIVGGNPDYIDWVLTETTAS